KLPPVMQNTAALGALLHLMGFDVEVAAEILSETFKKKGQEVIDQNVGVLRAGHEYAAAHAQPLGQRWKFSRKRRPVVTGNQMIALGAVAGGCKFYSAYPMSPASFILHWLAAHSEQVGVLVKQAEDELAVVNLAIGAGHAGVRSMCATSGGGFALMTEAIGMAGMIETPVVVVNVQRGGPSTGIPTKTEQGDLNQAFGASQGDYPRVIVAVKDALDCFHATVEAFNLAETFQLPVILISDLLLGEHRSTVDPEAIPSKVPIERGEWVTELAPEASLNGGYKRYALTPSGVSPRARPGRAGMIYVSGTDDHDEKGILISDEHTNPAIRRKMHEKRMRKMDGVRARLKPPVLEGPAAAEVTLIGWGSTWSVIQEAAAELTRSGLKTNQLHFKYIHPFHGAGSRLDPGQLQAIHGAGVHSDHERSFGSAVRPVHELDLPDRLAVLPPVRALESAGTRPLLEVDADVVVGHLPRLVVFHPEVHRLPRHEVFHAPDDVGGLEGLAVVPREDVIDAEAALRPEMAGELAGEVVLHHDRPL
ncbi:MAG: hypothetical protein DMF79_18535, partial [Acidobacteria bacterium]